MGHLHEHAGAVAGVGLGTAGAAVIEIHEDLQALLHDLVGLAALDVDDEADAAGVVLELRIVETLLRRQTGPAGLAPFSAAAHFFPRVSPNPLYSILGRRSGSPGLRLA